MNKKIFKSRKNDDGVSPVIGVILMVAITVVMAAIVSSWSSGIKAPTTPTTIGLDISRSNNNVTIVIASIDPITSAPLPNVNVTYTNVYNMINTTSFSNVDVGQPIEITTYSSSPSRVIITATYKDSSKKVLYSQEV